MKVLYEILKNFKLIFRNWSSLILVILAPLFLILLVGYSFSGEHLHDVKIGVSAPKDMSLAGFQSTIEEFGDIYRYGDIDDCIDQIINENIHICLEITGNLVPENGEIPSGKVVFYYDNTREKISLLLMSELKDYFGLTSEQISLISTQEIISSIQDLLVFLGERMDDVDSIQNESNKIMFDLKTRKGKLIDLKDDFDPKYLIVKDIQKQFNDNKKSLDNESEALLLSLEDLRNILAEQNMTNTTDLDILLDNLEIQITNLEARTDNTVEYADNISDSLNSAVTKLDQINLLLDQEIKMTDEYIILINDSTKKIESVSSEARKRMSELSEIDPSLAGKIAKPITQSFKVLVKDVKDIQLAFPILLSLVIMFISLIFSNIITSLEINNRAYTRNILAPVNDLIYTTGLAITNLIVVSFQVAVLLIVAQLRFNIDIVNHLKEIIPISFILILIFVFIGMILAYMSKSIQTSILTSTFLALGFFLLSDALNALEAMPVLAAQVAVYNPLVVVGSMFRQVFFFDTSLSALSNHIGLLIIYLAGMGFLLVVVSKIKNKQRF